MDDYRTVVLEELKSINRKLERLDDKIDNRESVIRSELMIMEDSFRFQLEPIKKHVTQVKFMSVLIGFLVPLSVTIYRVIH